MRIALYPGDGIGIEVTREAVRALEAARDAFGFGLKTHEFDWGSRLWKRAGRVVPEDYLDALRDFDAVFLGALGDAANAPDHVTLRPLIEMRQSFDQYVCLRPAKLLPGVETPLAGKSPGDIDLVIVRENSEGEYALTGGRVRTGRPHEVAVETSVHTRMGVERIVRYGFELARERRETLTVATKSNALRYGMVLWDEVLVETADAFPDVSAEKCHVDALAMGLVRYPERYDVIVASNLFGDILSDLAGAITGSLGLAPSANLNPEREFPSLFEPVHGSAPDIAGQGIANPIAAIRSVAMMLRFLEEADAAEALDAAVVENLADPSAPRAPDIGGAAGTTEVGEDIARRIR